MAGKAETQPGSDLDLIMGKALPEVEDRDATSEAIIREILAAEGLGELFRSRSTVATRDLIGTPLLIRGVRLMRSNIEGIEGVWMLIDAVRLDTGEPIAVNTGAKNIMAILWRANELERLPVEVEIVHVGRARPGENAPLGLAPYGQTAEAALAEQKAAV